MHQLLKSKNLPLRTMHLRVMRRPSASVTWMSTTIWPKAVAGWTYIHDRATGKLLCRSPNMIPHENLFAQPRVEDVRMLPGANGGVE